jgi:hypothetical protein
VTGGIKPGGLAGSIKGLTRSAGYEMMWAEDYDMDTLVFEGENLRSVFGPIVYTFFSPTGRALYVGSSDVGLVRAFTQHQDEKGRNDARKDATRLQIDFFGTHAEALKQEKLRIYELDPVYNVVGKPYDLNKRNHPELYDETFKTRGARLKAQRVRK